MIATTIKFVLSNVPAIMFAAAFFFAASATASFSLPAGHTFAVGTRVTSRVAQL